MDIDVVDYMFYSIYSDNYDGGEYRYHTMNKNLTSLLEDITNIQTNYDTLDSDEFLRIIYELYDIMLDEDCWREKRSFTSYGYYSAIVNWEPVTDSDMIELYNLVGNTSFKKMTSIKTNIFTSAVDCYGHGADYDEDIYYFQKHLIILTDTDLDREKIYTNKEIDELVKKGIIFIIAPSYQQISKREIPNKVDKNRNFGVDKESDEYKAALVKVIKKQVPKWKLFRDTRKMLNEIRRGFSDWWFSSEEEKKLYGVDKLENLYQLKYKNKNKWN